MFFDKNKKQDTSNNTAAASSAAVNSADIQSSVDDVMKKFDRESNVRLWEGTPKIIVITGYGSPVVPVCEDTQADDGNRQCSCQQHGRQYKPITALLIAFHLHIQGKARNFQLNRMQHRQYVPIYWCFALFPDRKRHIPLCRVYQMRNQAHDTQTGHHQKRRKE